MKDMASFRSVTAVVMSVRVTACFFRPVKIALLKQTELRWESADSSGCLGVESPVQALLPVCGEQLYQFPARHPESSLPSGAVHW